MARKKSSFLSDLVRDSRIETEFLGSCIKHVFHETGRLVGERRSRREERWVRQCFLGQGSYGIVYLEKLETDPSRARAVKEIKKFVVPGQELDYTRELEAIMKFSHPKYRHCFVTSRGWFDLEDSVYITMDFHELGDLQRHLEKPLPEVEAKEIAEQVLEGLGFMHENGFIHRDLKPANIMVVEKQPTWWVKIADFGISKRRQHDVTTMFTLQRGTPGFAAPEAIIADDPNETYTFSVDMWSLGAVAYKMLTNSTAFLSIASLLDFSRGALPFPTLKLAEHRVSDDGKDFIRRLMQARPDARLTAVSAEQHPWITNILTVTTEGKSLSCTEEEGDMAQEITNISMASRAWSTDGLTIMPATCTKRSNYQPPSVTDHLDETDVIVGLTFPADPKFPLLDVVSEDRGISLLDYEPASLPSQRVQKNTTFAQESSQDCPNVESEEGKSLEAPHKLGSDDDAVPRAEGGASKLNSAVAQVLDTEPMIHLQNCQDQVHMSGSEVTYNDSCEETEAGPSQLYHTEKVYQVPSPHLPNPTGDENKETSNKTQKVADDAVVAQENNHPTQQSRVVCCSNCEEAFSYSSSAIELLACGHVMCHSCLIRLICLALVSPRHMPPRCCKRAEGEIGLQQFSRLILIPDIDEMITRISSLNIGWKCPLGHSAKGGYESLLTTTGYTPIWKETVNCSGCLTAILDPAGTKSSTKVVPTEFCLLCSREIGSQEDCDCWSIWNFIEKILAMNDSRLSWTDAALQRAYDTRIKMKDGAKISYQTLQKATRSWMSPKMTYMGLSRLFEPTAQSNQPGDDYETEDNEEEDDLDPDEGDYDTEVDDEEDDSDFSDDESHEDDLDDDLDTDSEPESAPRLRLNVRPKHDHHNKYPTRPSGPPPELSKPYIDGYEVEYSRRLPTYTNQHYAFSSQGPTFLTYPPPPTYPNNHIPSYPIPNCECYSPLISSSLGGLAFCCRCGGKWGSVLQTSSAYPVRPYTIRPSPRTESETPSLRLRESPLPPTSENQRHNWTNEIVRKVESDRLVHLNGETNPNATLEGARIEDIKMWLLTAGRSIFRT